MQNGEYITDRLLPGMVRQACERHGVSYQALSDDWALCLEQSGAVRWVFGYKFDINLAAAASVAQDKVAAYQILAASGIRAMPHVLARSVPGDTLPVEILLQTFGNKSVVMKPLTGTGGKGVTLYADVGRAIQALATKAEPAWAISPYYDIAAEFRIVVLGGEVVAAYEKTNPVMRNGLKFFNLGMGAVARDIDPDPELRKLALSAAAAVSLNLAAVDIIRTEAGGYCILEINDGIMMENYARQSPEYEKSAIVLYDAIVTHMFS